jgi:hypothetical protein
MVFRGVALAIGLSRTFARFEARRNRKRWRGVIERRAARPAAALAAV